LRAPLVHSSLHLRAQTRSLSPAALAAQVKAQSVPVVVVAAAVRVICS
jgi:hypothetical protein